MIALNRPDLKLLLLTIATFVALTLAAPDAFADSDVKRSAGSMKRSTGSAAKSGTSMRTSGRSGPKLPSEGRRKKDDDKKKATKYKYDSADDDEEGEADFGARSLGKSCMYGTGGEVIFRPRGAQCKGDAPAGLDQLPRRNRDSEEPSEATSRSTETGPDRFGPVPTKRRPSRPRPASECIWGSEGQVLHTPAGGFCRPGGPRP